MKKMFVTLLICILCCSCSNDSKKQSLEDIISNKEYIVIDVRTKEEYNSGHVKDSINISFDEIDESIEIDKDKIILVYCRSGARSKIAYDKLSDLGYTVYDLGAYDNINMDKE